MSDYQVLTLSDFESNPLFNFDGGFNGRQGDVDALNKALGTGAPGGATGEAYGDYASMGALMPQSLEGTLKTVLATDKHLKISKQIAKKTAWNTTEEYNRVTDYGGDSSAFFVDGGLPNEEDSKYERASALVKFMGTTRTITHGAEIVRNAHGDMIARESDNGTKWIMQQLERAIFFGDSALDPLSFDGIYKQIKTYSPWNVIDMRGQPLTETALNQATRQVAEQMGFPEKLYGGIASIADLSEILYGRQRTGYPNTGSTLGNVPTSFKGHGGQVDFEPSVFLRPGGAPKTTSSDGSPAVPTIAGVTTPVAAAADTSSQMSAGTYYYWVSAVNSKGESTPVALGSAAIASGQKATLTWNRSASAPAARSYKIFRGTKNDVTAALFMKQVKDAGSGTTQSYDDKNDDIPGTSVCFMLDMDDEQSLCFKQLAPLMKLPLARVSAATRFMILLYGMPVVYNTNRNLVFKNVGSIGNNTFPRPGTNGLSANISFN